MEGGWLKVSAVAARMGLSKMTVYRLIHDGAIEAVKVGRSYRINETKFEQYLEKARVSGDDDSRD